MKKKLLVVPLAIIFPFIASCNSGGDVYNVTITKIDGLSIDKTTVKPGEDFVATISIDEKKITGKLLPMKLDKVTSCDTEIDETSYTYEPTDTNLTAELRIPAARIIGNVNIQISLSTCTVDNEAEFENAIHFTGIDYVQLTWHSPNKNESPGDMDYSPTVCYYKSYGGSGEHYYSKLSDSEAYHYYYEDSEWKKESFEPTDFPKTEDIYETLEFNGLTGHYEEFEFDGKMYSIDIHKLNPDLEGIYYIKFLDKKVVYNCPMVKDKTTEELVPSWIFKSTYNVYTPELPEIG